jgi:hypothetical protein
VYEELAAPFVLRTPDQINGLFAGIQLVDPGVVPVQRWQPARGRPGPAVPVLGGVGQVGAPVPGTVQAARPAGRPSERHATGSTAGVWVAGDPVSGSPVDPSLDARPASLPLTAPEQEPRRSPRPGRLPDRGSTDGCSPAPTTGMPACTATPTSGSVTRPPGPPSTSPSLRTPRSGPGRSWKPCGTPGSATKSCSNCPR